MTPHQIKTLRTRFTGLVTNAKDLRDALATDGGVFSVTPSAVLYPVDAGDVQAAAAYAHEQAQAGKQFGLTGRGYGDNVTSAALSDGAVLVFPTHMHRLKGLHKDTVSVQPGMSCAALQSLLQSHGRYLPSLPVGSHATVGGAVADNSINETSARYGTLSQWVSGLKVVLDDGSLIETRRMSRREVGRKKGLMTREGDLYRGIDGLLEDNANLIKAAQPQVELSAAGYGLKAVRGRDGSIDLSQLFIGSQGTLGLITEISFTTTVHEPRRILVAGYFDDVEKAGEAIVRLQRLQPSSLELVDGSLLTFLSQHHANTIEGLVPDEMPQLMILATFDQRSHLRQNRAGRQAERAFHKYAATQRTFTNRRDQDRMWAITRSAGAAMHMGSGTKKALPLLDARVPLHHVGEFMQETTKLLAHHKVEGVMWGHIGAGQLQVHPSFDLTKKKDRKTIFSLMDDFYGLVIRLDGTTAGASNDGLLKAAYLERLYGPDVYQLLSEIKQVCDPHGLFNAQVKLGATKKDLEQLLRHEYSVKQIHAA